MTKSVKFQTVLAHSVENMGWHYLVVEKDVVGKFAFKGSSKRVLCSINGGDKFPAGLMPWGEIFYIIVNKQRRDALGITAGDRVSVELVKDESKYGMPMPVELAEVLKQDAEGDRLFHALSAGMQRSLLYFVGKIKDIDRRISTSLILIDHLKRNDGKLVHGVLHEELKRPIF